jgi:hypothetical protein
MLGLGQANAEGNRGFQALTKRFLDAMRHDATGNGSRLMCEMSTRCTGWGTARWAGPARVQRAETLAYANAF